ncbi:p21-activated protein kinase-interacting protein 1-like isoform X1 [Varroa jacobsoni]|uniref:P21-activated protein kinase-interacting protein 1-like n=2 Tax=Varroa destructor TaxID=109461 RepID=A0A7M7JR35_VARDE|nr:p21-activated protein kinase-interacting protein 1-like isoform X1 [Varroa destructor]XP_022706210.1 p21-activated protein kinase-interacting protein 1-like isoform X1 [Varroa jacobsoni]
MKELSKPLLEGVEEFEIVLATYENFVLGYSFRRLQDDLFCLVQSFANSGHRASVRTVASGGKFMASGSSDETIQLYNMASRKEMGSLVKHDGTINALRFHGQTHLFSASDDGTICVWDTGSWQCLRTLKGHKQAVNDIAVHSSGKLLLSVSRDKSLYTWNLVKGRPAFITNIKVEASRVEWCPTDGPGDLFLVIHANQCDIYSTAAGGIVGSIDFGKKISDLAFIGRHLVLSGEEGKVNIFDLSVRDDLGRVAPSCLVDFNADPSGARIKCVAYAGPSELMGCHYLVTATSEGVITVWRVNIASESSDDKNKVRQLTNTTAGCRVTACDIYIKATESDGPSAGDDRKAAAKQETVLKKTTATKKRPSKSENYQKKIDERRQQQFIVEPKKIRTLDIKQVRKPGTVKGKKT